MREPLAGPQAEDRPKSFTNIRITRRAQMGVHRTPEDSSVDGEGCPAAPRRRKGNDTHTRQSAENGFGQRFWIVPASDLIHQFKSSAEGLSAADAAERLERHGPNTLRVSSRASRQVDSWLRH